MGLANHKGAKVAIPRRELIDESVPGIYNVSARCVRRAFLCGWDSYAAKDYEHRKVWICERLRFLTEAFAIDLLSYAIMRISLPPASGPPQQTR